MKICHILDELSIGGLEKNVIEIVLGLSGHTQEVWCLRKKGVLAGDLEKRGVMVREFGISGGMTPALLMKLSRAVREGGFDIVHSHGAHPAMWGETAAFLAGVRIRIDHAQNQYYYFPLNQRIRLKILSYFAAKIIAVSEAVKKSLVEVIGIDKKKIDVIYNAAPDLAAHAGRPRAEVRKSLGFSESDLVVGSAGRLEQHKGHAYLLEAIAQVRQSSPIGAQCKCVIIGDGPAMDELRHQAARLGLDDSAVFTGWRDDVGELMLAMDLYVQPSTLIEGLPLVLAEAAACSLPLLATHIGGNPEIVRDGVNGYIVPPKDAGALAAKIAAIAGDKSLAKKMGTSSRAVWQKQFSLDEMVRKIQGVYDQSCRAS